MIPSESILDLIGNTPMVDVSNLSPNPNVRLIAKLENQNPFGSVKDRIAKSMIEDAEKNGRLKPGQRILEPSSGNTGIALAANDANPTAHYQTTGPEIWRDCPEITHFVAGLGTSGTLMGTGRFLKERNPDIQIVAVEPPLGETVEGLRNLDDGYIPPVFENWHGYDILDRKRVVRPRESIEWTRRIVNECGIFAGISTGASLAGAVKMAASIESGTIVFIVCDGGWKYLSTGAYTANLDDAEAAAEKIIYF